MRIALDDSDERRGDGVWHEAWSGGVCLAHEADSVVMVDHGPGRASPATLDVTVRKVCRCRAGPARCGGGAEAVCCSAAGR